ncbi:sigma-70 family RNA polymerase sigma factor [Nibribacter koreensis]|uniref:RNA polymerase sigma-70 factor, ECF subfamily n=1 Tax=Nibribacter koreensis TaxID=1084519 RepID=A0ABP8FV29_9BACT
MIRGEEKILSRLRSGDETCLRDLYQQHRDDFVHWACRQYQLEQDEAKDIFQVTMLAFYENAASGKLTHLSCELKTYLFAIAKNHIHNFLRNKASAANFVDVSDIKEYDNTLEEAETQDHQKTLVHQAIALLPPDSRKVLELYYFHDYDMASIAREMGYKNDNVAKVKKLQCLRKLSVILKEKVELLNI